jgi:hypothetical protein
VAHLSLKKAIQQDRLPEFVAQQEAAGLPPADPKAFEVVVSAAVKAKPAARRTSGSHTADGSTGSRTRRGKAAASRG